MRKKIKSSKRGLTFSFSQNESEFKPGVRYNYTFDGNNIIILPSENGSHTVSRKKTAYTIKSLLDLRSKEIVSKVQNTDHIEIEINQTEIIVHLIYKEKATAKVCRHFNVVNSIRSKGNECLVIPKTLMAAGNEDFVQLSFFDTFQETYPNTIKTISPQIKGVFSVVSLFSGCGMLDYPFAKDENFDIIFANDIGNGQVNSYRENIGNVIVKKDIRELYDVPKADVILGGPSCTPFSNVNRQKTRLKDHPDYYLIREYVRLVKHIDPKVFVIENVPEFTSTANGQILSDLKANLSDYTFSVNKICDSDIGGYTTRERVIIIGSKIGNITLNNFKVTPVKTVREALEKVDAEWFNYNDISKSGKELKKRMSYVQDGHNWSDVPPRMQTKSKFANYLKRLSPDKPAPAIVNFRKSCIMPPKEFLKNGEERILSVAEASALMGFDKHFKFLGSLSERQQQVANGVPYKIAYIIKETIKRFLLHNNLSLG